MSSAGTNPVAEGAAASDASEVNDETVVETHDNENEGADEGEESEGVQEDDTDEIDLDGKKYRIPKAVKPAIMMHGDYTKKTQELAEQRKQFEASRTAAVEADENHVKALGKLHVIDDHLKQYGAVNWTELEATDPVAAQTHWRTYSQLKELRQQTENEIKTAAETRTLETQRARAKQIEEAREQLPKLIPGWSHELDVKIANYGTVEGYSRQELAEATIQNPRYVATLNKARLWDEHLKAQKVAKRAAAQEEARPVAEVGSKSPAAKNPDRMSTEEWMKYEAARMAKKRAGR